MGKSKDNVQQTVFPDKWLKKLKGTGFVETADSKSSEELQKAIFEAEGNIYSIEKAKDACVKLQAARAVVKDEIGPFNESKGIETAKIKYALFLLESRGVDLDNS